MQQLLILYSKNVDIINFIYFDSLLTHYSMFLKTFNGTYFCDYKINTHSL